MNQTTPQYTTRPVDMSDYDAIESLWEARFGSADSMTMNGENLLELATDPFQACYMHVAVCENDELVGFAVGFVIPPETLQSWIKPTPESYVTAFLNGFVQAIAVSPDWEHQGIATDLLEQLLVRFSDVGAEETYAVSWRRENTIDSSGLFEKLAFDEIFHVDKFYAKGDSPRQDCPDCPTNPCTCDGTVYRKKLQPELL